MKRWLLQKSTSNSCPGAFRRNVWLCTWITKWLTIVGKFLKTFDLQSSLSQNCFKSSETKGISGWVLLCMDSAIFKSLSTMGFCQWFSTVNQVGSTLNGVNSQQVGHGTNSKPQYLYKKSFKIKAVSAGASSTYQALQCCFLVLFCLWHNMKI